MILGITGGTGCGKTTLLSLFAQRGGLDRKRLGARVFRDSAALEALNAITHHAVRAAVLQALEAAPRHAAIDAIALFESGLDRLCDATVAITAPLETRVARLMARDGIPEDYARSRIAAQHEEGWFRQRCNFILENDGTIQDFQEKCVAFLDAQGIIAVE